jgi:hypothetical protein
LSLSDDRELISNIRAMRAEIESIVADIKQSAGLLRRHL